MNQLIEYLISQEAIEIIGKFYHQTFLKKLDEISTDIISKEEKIEKIYKLIDIMLLTREQWPWYFETYLANKQFPFKL